MIYGNLETDVDTDQGQLQHDTNRFDVNPLKLVQYKQTNFKKLVKKRFVTGMTKDKILENLMNMSDSDNEKDKDEERIQRDQLRRMEANEHKNSKVDKKRKRLANKGVKLETDSDELSQDIDEESGDEQIDKIHDKLKKKEEESKHKPV